MKLLHIVATPRGSESNTLRISSALLESLHARGIGLSVEEIDLFNIDLPAVAGDNIESKYTLMVGSAIDKRHEVSWRQIESLIQRFLSADVYLISTPMWNFGIPYALKYYLDAVVQPGYLFRYNEKGQAIGLVQGKKAICVTTRGGDYSEGSPFQAYDFVEPYLRAILGFVGIVDVHFINAQPVDMSRELRETVIGAAISEAQELAASQDWVPDTGVTASESQLGLKPAPLQDS